MKIGTKSSRGHLLVAVLVTLLILGPAKTRAGDTPADVKITRRAPIETISSSGEVTGVAESIVGSKLSLVKPVGLQVILQDAQGVHYQIALSATDYMPPAAAPSSSNDTAQAAAPKTNSPPVVPPVVRTPSPNMVSATNAPPSDQQAPITDAITSVPIEDRKTDNVMSVWPQGGISSRPLLIAAHGNGGSGPQEIKGWLDVAKQHHFTIVCPTFLSSVNTVYLPQDKSYFEKCLRWIDDNLQYDKGSVFMTGFSGGGYPTWYLATQRPDFFRGLFLESGNFVGDILGLNLNRWYDKPIKVIWGSQDLPDIPIQGQKALDALKTADCKSYTNEVVQGAGHQEHQDLVATWLDQVVSSSSTN